MEDAERPRTGLDLYAAALAFVLPLAYSPSIGSRFLTPKSAVLLTALPVGLLLLPRVARNGGRRAVIAAVAFAVVALAAALTSGSPVLAVLGNYDQQTGWLFIAGCIGAWAIGRCLSEDGSRLVTLAVAGSLALNATVAVLQHLTDLSVLGLQLQADRSTGLVGNPVHLGSLLAGLAALSIRASRSHRGWLGVVFVAGVGTQAAGSRLAVVVIVLVALVELVRERRWHAVLPTVCLVLGLAAGQAVVANSTGASSTGRLASGVVENSTTARLHTWSSAPHIIADRPLLGWGPGRYAIASERHKPLALVRANGDRVFVDAHNLFVEYVATTGTLGVAALSGFLLFAARPAQGPLALFSGAVFLLLLVQPLHPATAPLAALALGAAVPGARRHRPPAAVVGAMAAGAVAAVAASAVLLSAEARVAAARLDYDAVELAAARDLLPPWPELLYEESLMWVFAAEAEDQPELYDRAVRLRREAVGIDPEDSRARNHLGAILLKVGDLEGAQTAFASAVERAPRFVAGHIGLARAALARGEIQTASQAIAEAERLHGESTAEIRELRRAVDERENDA